MSAGCVSLKLDNVVMEHDKIISAGSLRMAWDSLSDGDPWNLNDDSRHRFLSMVCKGAHGMLDLIVQSDVSGKRNQ
jgi:hypothetical protein